MNRFFCFGNNEEGCVVLYWSLVVLDAFGCSRCCRLWNSFGASKKDEER